MTNIDIEALKEQIAARLMPLSPKKAILFGSYAYGTPNQDSDIDLYVVTDDDFVPQNWREKSIGVASKSVFELLDKMVEEKLAKNA